MENKEISNSPLKPKTRNLLLGKTENQNSINFSNNNELIKYINDLSKIIKIYYKLNTINFKQINNCLEQDSNQVKNKKIIQNVFKDIEDSFSKFYNNAKEIFKKMKDYRAKQISNNFRNRKENNSMGKFQEINNSNYNIMGNNINISNSIINNDTININGKNISMTFGTENNINNEQLKIEKIFNENVSLKKKIDDLEKKENNSNIININKENK